MNRISTFRAALAALSMVALGGVALAQSPAPSASPAPSPSAVPSPAPSAVPVPPPAETKSPADAPTAEKAPAPAASASPTPAPSATPVPPPAENKSPADSPAAAAPPPAVAPVQTADPFGQEITLTPKKVVVLKGTANWDSAFETLMDSFKALTALLDKQSIAHTGNGMIVYTSTDDTGFTFLAEIPVDQEPKNLGKTMSVGQSPEIGRAHV